MSDIDIVLRVCLSDLAPFRPDDLRFPATHGGHDKHMPALYCSDNGVWYASIEH